MNDLGTIIRAADRLRREQEPFVLATVVRVLGSAYRRPGARMLFTRERWVAGSVSGGCLEHDLLEKGWWKTRDGASVTVTFDARADGELGWGLGLGCDGLVEVLLQPSGPAGCAPLAFLAGCFRGQRRGAMATVFAGGGAPLGAHMTLSTDGSIAFVGFDPRPFDGLLAECGRALRDGRTRVARCRSRSGVVDTLVESITPPPRLFLVGARHDALPVARMALALGWEVVVADGGARVSTRERFAHADGILFGSADDLSPHVDESDRAMAVVMTHDYERDRDYLRALLGTNVRYIGMLGPRDRTARMARDLGVARLDDRVHAPVGLALGAETPEEIAVAIVAECQSVLTGSHAIGLRDLSGPIHGDSAAESRAMRASG